MKPVITALLSLVITTAAFAQQATARSEDAVPVVAFVNVSVIAMDGEHVEPRQIVVVRGEPDRGDRHDRRCVHTSKAQWLSMARAAIWCLA